MNWRNTLLRVFRLIRGVLVAGVGFGALLAIWAAWARPELATEVVPVTVSQIAAASATRDISFDPHAITSLPRVQVPVDYSLGAPAQGTVGRNLSPTSFPPPVRQPRWWPQRQSPLLDQLQAAGKLPPLSERIGPEPLVLDGGSVGKYGGTWLRVAPSSSDVFMFEFRLGYASLFRWSPLGKPIVPHLATSVDISEDRRQFIVHLRRGVRWSDGHPFTADDILFWWQYDEIDTTVGNGAPPPWLTSGNGKTHLEKLDDYSFLIRFDEPFGNFMESMATNSLFMTRYPKHYFEKYHPDLADPEFLKGELAALGLSSPFNLWRHKLHRYDNPEVPRLWPWVLQTYSPDVPFVFVRNPYYFAVDTEGNQLPYIDRMQFDGKTKQMLPLSFSNGDVSMQARHVSFDNYTELMSRRELGGYEIRHWYPAQRSDWVVYPSLNRVADPERPETVHKARLLSDKRFRQALSLAIDREAIIEAHYDGLVEPSQVEPGPESPFHHAGLRNAFIEHDPRRANALLDALGLVRRDADGMRSFPDGQPMTFYLMFCDFPGVGPAEFVVDDWRTVGLRVIAQERSRRLFEHKKNSGDFDLAVWTSSSDYFPLLEPALFAPGDKWGVNAVAWGRWFERGGFFGASTVDAVGNAYPPPPGHPMLDSYRALVEARQLGTEAEQVARFREALDIAADNIWAINIADSPPALVVVDSDLRNVPRLALNAASARTPANAGIETYYFEHPSHAADEETMEAIATVTPIPRTGTGTLAAGSTAASSSSSGSGADMASLVRWLLWGIVLAFIGLTALRHPFVVRRLLVLIPTLWVMSVAVFIVIQLPPGDYITAHMLDLAQTGDTNALEQIEELRRIFHFDEPVWKQYLRWMGVLWFQTFDAVDTGLLQGNLGRAMETNRSVNELVGDRVLLTVSISAGTIFLTWLLAIPIGIYSAVRQYSFFDYLFTFVGFVGMSVPPFLLALVLMVLAGVSGLFSPQFAAQPSWDMPKLIDLLRHIWVPIVVMGLSGTAGLARVMRANLLDELRKPYVTTARARGVRPLRLLLKYPVRVALNPFVSGIGQLFPQLISGGAIVAIVLSLPTVGPLQIHALLAEDTYLAGSMLMVLSLLSVFGTLVADLMLVWLDPRIRFEGRIA